MPSNFPDPTTTGPARLIAGVFGFAFFGIGLTVLGFLWLTPFDQFGSPPLVFRLFGSFIALVFTVAGGSLAFSAITNKLNPMGNMQQAIIQQAQTAASQPLDFPALSYTCPHCAAPLQSHTDVSPSGDVKCSFCNSWFNIHRQR